MELHLTFCHSLVVEVAGIVCHVEQVGHIVDAHGVGAGALQRHVGDALVDKAAGLELPVAAFAVEGVLERLLHAAVHEVAEVARQHVDRLPCLVVDAVRVYVVVRLYPRRRGLEVIVRRAPVAVVVVYPQGSVGGMAGREHGGVAERGHGIYNGTAVGGHFQFVANGGCAQVLGRRAVLGQVSAVFAVVNAEHRAQGLLVEPARPDYAVVVGGGARGYGGHGRCPVYGREGVGGVGIDHPFGKEHLEAVAAVKRGEGLQVVGAQLVDGYVHHQLGGRLYSLRHLCLASGGGEGGEQCQ